MYFLLKKQRNTTNYDHEPVRNIPAALPTDKHKTVWCSTNSCNYTRQPIADKLSHYIGTQPRITRNI